MIFEEKTLDTKSIYKGKILNLRKDKVTTVEGESYREIIEHNGAVAVLAMTKEDEVVLVRQFRKPFEREIVEIPAGKIEKNELPEETVKRELKEETGYTAGRIEFLTKILPSVGYSTEEIYIYLAKDLVPGETNFDEGEAIETFTCKFEELIDKIKKGEVQDGKTIIATLLLKLAR